ncbi:hypothetical protein CYMTET_18011, partial [Cymbomonas tetramitiformis]
AAAAMETDRQWKLKGAAQAHLSKASISAFVHISAASRSLSTCKENSAGLAAVKSAQEAYSELRAAVEEATAVGVKITPQQQDSLVMAHVCCTRMNLTLSIVAAMKVANTCAASGTKRGKQQMNLSDEQCCKVLEQFMLAQQQAESALLQREMRCDRCVEDGAEAVVQIGVLELGAELEALRGQVEEARSWAHALAVAEELHLALGGEPGMVLAGGPWQAGGMSVTVVDMPALDEALEVAHKIGLEDYFPGIYRVACKAARVTREATGLAHGMEQALAQAADVGSTEDALLAAGSLERLVAGATEEVVQTPAAKAQVSLAEQTAQALRQFVEAEAVMRKALEKGDAKALQQASSLMSAVQAVGKVPRLVQGLNAKVQRATKAMRQLESVLEQSTPCVAELRRVLQAGRDHGAPAGLVQRTAERLGEALLATATEQLEAAESIEEDSADPTAICDPITAALQAGDAVLEEGARLLGCGKTGSVWEGSNAEHCRQVEQVAQRLQGARDRIEGIWQRAAEAEKPVPDPVAVPNSEAAEEPGAPAAAKGEASAEVAVDRFEELAEAEKEELSSEMKAVAAESKAAAEKQRERERELREERERRVRQKAEEKRVRIERERERKQELEEKRRQKEKREAEELEARKRREEDKRKKQQEEEALRKRREKEEQETRRREEEEAQRRKEAAAEARRREMEEKVVRRQQEISEARRVEDERRRREQGEAERRRAEIAEVKRQRALEEDRTRRERAEQLKKQKAVEKEAERLRVQEETRATALAQERRKMELAEAELAQRLEVEKMRATQLAERARAAAAANQGMPQPPLPPNPRPEHLLDAGVVPAELGWRTGETEVTIGRSAADSLPADLLLLLSGDDGPQEDAAPEDVPISTHTSRSPTFPPPPPPTSTLPLGSGMPFGPAHTSRPWSSAHGNNPAKSPNQSSRLAGDDIETCVVCMDAPREAAFVHGNSLHKCVCRVCAQDLLALDHSKRFCPLCREPILTVVYNFH